MLRIAHTQWQWRMRFLSSPMRGWNHEDWRSIVHRNKTHSAQKRCVLRTHFYEVVNTKIHSVTANNCFQPFARHDCWPVAVSSATPGGALLDEPEPFDSSIWLRNTASSTVLQSHGPKRTKIEMDPKSWRHGKANAVSDNQIAIKHSNTYRSHQTKWEYVALHCTFENIRRTYLCTFTS